MWLFDTLVNFVSSLGTDRDKTTASEYTVRLLTKNVVEKAYRGDWVARKLIDIPSHDSTREWRAWEAEDDQITKLEAEEKRLDLQRKTKRWIQLSRLYGGALMVMGVQRGTSEQELRLDTCGQGCIDFVHVLHRYEVSCGPIVYDITSPWYGQPEYYETRNGVLISRIHPSRAVRLVGAEMPDIALSSDGWGDSVLQAVDDAVRAVGIVNGGIVAMIQDAKLDVVKIQDLTAKISNQEYAKKLTERFQYANVAKSIINTLVLDKEEEWERIQSSFAGLPEIIQMYLLIASGAADIPATRMLGQSPKGLGSTGDHDTRNYYDRIGADQRTIVQPALNPLDEVVIRSALGARDPKIHYTWNPLWQMDDAQVAEVAFKKAQAHKIDVDAGLINVDALRIARENQLVEDGTYPGLELALEEADKAAQPDLTEPTAEEKAALMLPPPGNENDPGKPAPGKKAARPGVASKVADMRRLVRDARPRTLYVYRELLNREEFFAWAREQGFKNVLDDPHVTLAYSETPVDWMKMGVDWYGSADSKGTITVPAGGARVVERLGPAGAVVLLFNSSDLCWRHRTMCDAGATWKWGDDYQPHITIAYDPPGDDVEKMGDADLDNVEPYRGELVFGPEIFEEIDTERGDGDADRTALEAVGDRRRDLRKAPARERRPAYDAESAEERTRQMLRELGDSLTSAVRALPPPVVTVPVTVARGRVVKDVEHDKDGRVSRIVETEEVTGG